MIIERQGEIIKQAKNGDTVKVHYTGKKRNPSRHTPKQQS
jgi:FKBP-type peptidyl-prolyl cis-trans isomerase